MIREKLFSWKGKQRNGFLIIPNHDLHAGFGALILYALNGLRKAEEKNLIPVIDFNHENCPYFFDELKGENIWEYYFEKVSPNSHKEIKTWLETGLLSNNEVTYVKSAEAATTHQYDPHRLATFWAWEEPLDKSLWMEEKRALGRKYIQKYVQPKTHILEKLSQFIEGHFKADFIIGAHIRGSDFAYAQPTPLERYFKEIDRLLKERPDSNCRIFVATDQQQFLKAFNQRYEQKVVSLDVTRSDNHIAPFRFDHFNGYLKGEEVLLDMLLLSKCHHLIKGAAAIGELASWFVNHNAITDFALQSEFNQKPYHQLESTYAQMNIAEKSKGALKIHRLRERLIRMFIESRLGKTIYYRSALVRKLLKH